MSRKAALQPTGDRGPGLPIPRPGIPVCHCEEGARRLTRQSSCPSSVSNMHLDQRAFTIPRRDCRAPLRSARNDRGLGVREGGHPAPSRGEDLRSIPSIARGQSISGFFIARPRTGVANTATGNTSLSLRGRSKATDAAIQLSFLCIQYASRSTSLYNTSARLPRSTPFRSQ